MAFLPLPTYSVTHAWSTLRKNVARPKETVKTKNGDICFIECLIFHDLNKLKADCKSAQNLASLQERIDLSHIHVSKDGAFLVEHSKGIVPVNEFEALCFQEADPAQSLNILIAMYKEKQGFKTLELKTCKTGTNHFNTAVKRVQTHNSQPGIFRE